MAAKNFNFHVSFCVIHCSVDPTIVAAILDYASV